MLINQYGTGAPYSCEDSKPVVPAELIYKMYSSDNSALSKWTDVPSVKDRCLKIVYSERSSTKKAVHRSGSKAAVSNKCGDDNEQV